MRRKMAEELDEERIHRQLREINEDLSREGAPMQIKRAHASYQPPNEYA